MMLSAQYGIPRAPRIRGDDPAGLAAKDLPVLCSPHPRG